MKFSIRALLVLTFIAALIITAVLQYRELDRLRKELEIRTSMLARSTRSLGQLNLEQTRNQLKVYEQVLADAGIGPELFAKAKRRFQQMQADEADSE